MSLSLLCDNPHLLGILPDFKRWRVSLSHVDRKEGMAVCGALLIGNDYKVCDYLSFTHNAHCVVVYVKVIRHLVFIMDNVV